MSPPDERWERFRPTTGVVTGGIGLAAAAVVVVVGLVTEPNLLGVRVALGALLVAALVWLTLLRPRAAASPDTLVLRNILSDISIPLARVDDAVVRHTLNVWVGDQRYVGVGIGRSSRSMLRGSGRRGVGGFGLRHTEHEHDALAAPTPETDYATFVERRILELAEHARARKDGGGAVRRSWAVPEIAGIGLLTAVFAVALLL